MDSSSSTFRTSMSIMQDKVNAIVKTEGKEGRSSVFSHIVHHMCARECMSGVHARTQSPEASDLSTRWSSAQQPTPMRTDWAVCVSPREMCTIWEEEVRLRVCAGVRWMCTCVQLKPCAEPVPWNLHLTPFISKHIPCRGHSFEYKV